MEVYLKWNCAVSGIVVRKSKHSATVQNVRDIPCFRPVWRVVTAEKFLTDDLLRRRCRQR